MLRMFHPGLFLVREAVQRCTTDYLTNLGVAMTMTCNTQAQKQLEQGRELYERFQQDWDHAEWRLGQRPMTSQCLSVTCNTTSTMKLKSYWLR